MVPRRKQVGTYNPIMRRLYCSYVLFALGSKELYLHQLGLRTATNQACLTAAGIIWPELWCSLRLKSVVVSDMALPAQWNSSTSRTSIAICMRNMVMNRVKNIRSSLYTCMISHGRLMPLTVLFFGQILLRYWWQMQENTVWCLITLTAGSNPNRFTTGTMWLVVTNQHGHNMFSLKTTGTLCSFFCPCILRLSVGCVYNY